MNSNEIKNIIAGMTLEQKIGQRLTFGFSGSVITDDFMESMERFHCGGLRLSPYSNNFEYKAKPDTKSDYEPLSEPGAPSKDKMLSVGIAPYLNPEQYASLIDRFQEKAKDINNGIPLIVSVDQEGGVYADIVKGGIALFPTLMGMAATGDKEFARRIAVTVGRQLKDYGVNMVHGPVLDVNVLPDNVEIDIRSFSDDPEICAEFGSAAAAGYQESGVIATAKHFPGRGNSNLDSHFHVPVIEGTYEEFSKRDFVPYKRLIAQGLDSVMLAHTIYPGLDESGMMATVSPRIVEILRKDLGFQGIITTDSITMAALIEKYGAANGAAMSLQAGCDLVLLKEESPLRGEVFYTVKDYIKKGLITDEQLDESLFRILNVKARRGLFDSAPAAPRAAKSFPCPKTAEFATEASVKAMFVDKNEDNLLPISKEKEIYLVEQIFPDRSANDAWNHPRKLYETLLENGFKVKYRSELVFHDHAMCSDPAPEVDKSCKYLDCDDYDILLTTSIYSRTYQPDSGLVREIIAKAKRPVLLVTNTPYPTGRVSEASNIILNFNSTPWGYQALADVLSGKSQPKGQLPLSDKMKEELGF